MACADAGCRQWHGLHADLQGQLQSIRLHFQIIDLFETMQRLIVPRTRKRSQARILHRPQRWRIPRIEQLESRSLLSGVSSNALVVGSGNKKSPDAARSEARLQADGQESSDTVPPRIIAASLQQGAVLDGGLFTIQITFSEPILVSNISNDDVSFHANIANLDYPFNIARSFDQTGTVLTLQYRSSSIYDQNRLPEDTYTLTLIAGATGGSNFTDLAGNALDGEFQGVFPTGDGVAGGNFVEHFSVDAGSHVFPPRLTPLQPLGSLDYQGSVTKSIDFDGDQDAFTLQVGPGQTISAIVSPINHQLQPHVRFLDPSAR